MLSLDCEMTSMYKYGMMLMKRLFKDTYDR
jgi:hypothetical protein